jgi:hypothetical protein
MKNPKYNTLFELIDHERPISKSEINLLAMTQSQEQWNIVCRGIKASRNGYYPRDWWDQVVQSGLMDRKTSEFKGDAK